jgi:glycosyltransferase involved in cell wall biosynthesis
MKARPKVLVLIDWYKPFFKAGGPVRSLVNMVEHLHKEVDLHIVTGDRDYMEERSPEGLRKDGWVKGDRGEMIWYASRQGRTLCNWMALLAQDWDVVYINGIFSKWSTIVPLWLLRKSKQRRIVVVRGMLARGPMRQGAHKKRLFLIGMKAAGAFNGVEFQATNEEEVRDIKRWIGKDAKVHLVPNLPRRQQAASPAIVRKKKGELHLISPARIAEEKGTLFAIERLAKLKGEVRFDLHGTVYDQGYWAKCEAAIAALPPNVKVELKGQLDNEAVMPRIAQAHVLFMPSTGENFGHAMLEALSVGRPLLISDRTPWRNLEEEKAGWDLPLEAPERFEQVLQELVDLDDEGFQRLCVGAFALGKHSLNDHAPIEKCLAMFMRG